MTINLKNRKHAFTLVEILVVVSILVILTGLLVPRLRVISSERQIREASRNVSSLFSRASQAAIIDGVSGVVLERNPNVSRQWPTLTVPNGPGLLPPTLDLAPFNFRHGGHRLSLLRSVPDFRGDRENSVGYLVVASVVPEVITELDGRYSTFTSTDLTTKLATGAILVEMETPIEHSKVNTFIDSNSTAEELLLAGEQERRKIIRPGDAIVFNNSNIEYRISEVLLSDLGTYDDPVLGVIPTADGERMLLEMAPSAYLPPPAGTEEVFGATPLSVAQAMPYRVIRRPRRLKSSQIELPEGFQIDLRFSGVGDQVFTPAAFDRPNGNPESIEILFDERGAVDRVDFDGAAGIGVQVASPIFFLVTRLSGTEDDGSANPLASDENLWVIVNPVTGTVHVGYNGSSEPIEFPAGSGTFITAKDFPDVDVLLAGHSLVPGAATEFSAVLSACRSFANTSTANQ